MHIFKITLLNLIENFFPNPVNKNKIKNLKVLSLLMFRKLCNVFKISGAIDSRCETTQQIFTSAFIKNGQIKKAEIILAWKDVDQESLELRLLPGQANPKSGMSL